MDPKVEFVLSVVGTTVGIFGFIAAYFRLDHWVVKQKAADAGLLDRPTRREKMMALLAIISVAFCAFGWWTASRQPSQAAGSSIVLWGNHPVQQRGFLIADTSQLQDKQANYKLAFVELLASMETNFVDIPLQKSGLFDIAQPVVPMSMPLSPEFVAHLSDESAMFVLLLVPDGVEMSQFSTLRQAKGLGVQIIGAAGQKPIRL